MTWLDLVAAPLLAKLCLVFMFPLSAYDKVAHWDEAMGQARSGPLPFPALLLVLGILVEAVTPVLIVAGYFDRAAAFVLAGFCAVTALMYHPFWRFPDFWSKNGEGRFPFLGLLQELRARRRIAVGGDRRRLRAGLAGRGAPVLGRALGRLHVVRSQPARVRHARFRQPLREIRMADQQNGGPPPKMPYWHVYTDADGMSRQERFELAAFKFEGIDPQTAPQWNDKQEPSQAGVTFTVLPVGWVGQWHENPRPQWIAILSGRWFVETMDGTRVEMGPGELMMGEDQNTKARDGRKGHLSGTVGDEPCTMIVTGLDVAPTVNRPGRFK